MKAAVYDRNGPPDVFRYEDVPDPPVHARGVIVEVAAVSIEGGDVLNRAGGALTSNPTSSATSAPATCARSARR